MTAYLVMIEGQRGPEAQIWHDNGGGFVGPPLTTLQRLELPEGEWSIDDALAYARANQPATGEANG